MVSMALLLAEPPALHAALRLAAAGPAKSSQGQWPPPQHSLSLWLTSLTHPQTLTEPCDAAGAVRPLGHRRGE